MKIGDKIRELRRRDGRTQENLAGELGVTAQAVSRWEKGVCYPDLDMIPAIANYFNVTIDELFGHDYDRDQRVEVMAARIEEMLRRNNGEDICMDECIALARQGLIEFPGNERLTCLLASALFTAGYVRHGEFHKEDGEGFGVYDAERHKTYTEWREAIKLYEKLLPAMCDGPRKQAAVVQLAQLYKNTGAHEKSLSLAENAPDIQASKPILRISAFDGKEAVAACGDALLEMVRTSAELMERIVLAEQSIMAPETAADMIRNAIRLFDLVCIDGYYGRLSAFASCLHMLRSYFLWLANNPSEAFRALDEALEQARRFDALEKTASAYYTAPLLTFVKTHAEQVPRNSAFRRELPTLWPWWDVAKRDRVKGEMEKDERWAAWMKRTKE